MDLQRSFRYWSYQLAVFLVFTVAIFCIWLNGRQILSAYRFNFIIDTYSNIVIFAPSDSPIKPRDKILSVNGVPATNVDFSDGLDPEGLQETASLTLMRGEERLAISLPVEKPTFWLLLLSTWWVLITAYLFLASGILLHYFHSAGERQLSTVYTIVSSSIALLITGMFTSGTITSAIAVYTAWFLFPAVAHLQLLFTKTKFTPWMQRGIGFGYLLAGSGYVLSVSPLVIKQIWQSRWDTVVGSWLAEWIIPIWAIGWSLLTIWFIFTRYRKVNDVERQREIGIVASGSIMSFTPALILSLVPGTLFGHAILPFQISFMMLIIAPISYAYAIRHYRFVRLERYISRAATIILTVLLTGGFYVLLSETLTGIFSPIVWDDLLVTTVTILFPALTFEPARQRIQRLFDWFTYGGWYDFESVISRVSATLTKTPSIFAFTQILSETMQQSMRVHWAGVLILEPGSRTLRPASVAGNEEIVLLFQDLRLSADGDLVKQIFSSDRPKVHHRLQKEISRTSDDNRVELIKDGGVHLFIPLRAGMHQAILLLGAKQSREPYNKSDLAILEVAARQATIALGNAALVDELKGKIRENEQYQRQIVRVRDEEGKRIAREIHDSLIQSLVAFKYQLADVQSNLDLHPTSVKMNLGISQLQDQLGGLIQDARHICHELRPETIELGLIPSLRSTVNQFIELHEETITFTVNGDVQEPKEDAILCLMRCLQESLKNIEKHAQAKQIHIIICQRNEYIRLEIKDDGIGFSIPKHLGSLMDNYHFGIIGMRERVELLGGFFHVESQPQSGSRLVFEVPVKGSKL